MVSIKTAIQRTGCTRGHLERLAFEGRIEKSNGMIPASYVEILIQERNMYIGLLEYGRMHTSDRFDADNVSNREKLYDVVETHNFYGLDVRQPEELLSGTARDIIFFFRKDVPVLDEHLKPFFAQFGMSEEEKVEKLLMEAKDQLQSIQYLRDYLMETGIQVTPAVTEFVSRILSIPDIPNLTDNGLQGLLTQRMPETTRDCIIQFCNYVKNRCNVKYSIVARKKREVIGIEAYTDDTYMALARFFFNSEYIHKNKMVEKAMQNHIFAEAWLYLTLFFACGWRAADVCRGWKYPAIDKDPGTWGICLETLDKDILEDRLPDATYEKVCQYSLRRLQVSGQIPGKTADKNPSPLLAVIIPELHTFYGLLTLIGESHRLRSGDGHMKEGRAPVYQNKMTIRNFFGEEAYHALHGENIQTRRLNKDFLQGTEEAARRTGCGGLMASAVASYARNHTNLNTVKSYLKDHQLTSETADVVLYFMLQRGCFGFESYNLLAIAYPDAFRKLSIEEQNRILSMTDTPLEIENKGSGIAAAISIQKGFIEDDQDTVLDMMKAMFEIGQNRGQGKDTGVYCLLRAGKKACKHPEYESCLANCCENLVFTRYAYIPLLQILKRFKDKAASGNQKAYAVLYHILVPRYQNILNELVKSTGMTPAEKEGLRLLLKENLNG